jgi:hypothetical protein
MAEYTTQYPPAHTGDYVKATSSYSTLSYSWPYYATDPAKSLTGNETYNSWFSNAQKVNQKFNIDLGAQYEIKRIYLENHHSSGASTTKGIKDFSIYGTNSPTAFANTTYADTTDLTLLDTLQATQHVAANTADPQYHTLGTTGSFRYYVLRITNNWGDGSYMGFRRIELQTELLYEGDIVLPGLEVSGAGGGYGGVSVAAPEASGGGGGYGGAEVAGITVSGGGGGYGGVSVALAEVDGVGAGGGGVILNNVTVSGTGEPGVLFDIGGLLYERDGGFNINRELVFELSGQMPGQLSGGFSFDEIDITGLLYEREGGFSFETSIEAELSGQLYERQGGLGFAVDAIFQLSEKLYEREGGFDFEVATQFEFGGSLYGRSGGFSISTVSPTLELGGQLYQMGGGLTFDGVSSCSGVLAHVRGAVC